MSVEAVRKLRGVKGVGEDISETLHPLALLLLHRAGEKASPLRGDYGEPSFPAVLPDTLGQVLVHFVPLVIAPQEYLSLALLKGIQWMLVIDQPALLGIQGKLPFLERLFLLWASLFHEALFEVVPSDEGHELRLGELRKGLLRVLQPSCMEGVEPVHYLLASFMVYKQVPEVAFYR